METELYEPIKKELLNNGFTVRSEVRNCDITALKEDMLVIIELKIAMNLTLIMQAMERQKVTPFVYIAVPRPKRANEKKFAVLKQMLKKLDIGLITVALDSRLKLVEFLLHPVGTNNPKKKQEKDRIIKEHESRSKDYNKGGTTRKKIITSYRENAIHIACCLEANGVLKIIQLKKLGCTSKTAQILRDNVYNWFDKVDRGTYCLNEDGKKAIYSDDFLKIANYYRQLPLLVEEIEVTNK